MRVWFWILIGAGALFALDRLALAAERRGWIFYRRHKASPGGVGNALLEVQAILEPRARATIEARAERGEPGESADDPPEPSSAARSSDA